MGGGWLVVIASEARWAGIHRGYERRALGRLNGQARRDMRSSESVYPPDSDTFAQDSVRFGYALRNTGRW